MAAILTAEGTLIESATLAAKLCHKKWDDFRQSAQPGLFIAATSPTR
jgi:hypothetical protein